ncbi:hypothetical protein Tco_1222903, partial [Tanacetum coccineum]
MPEAEEGLRTCALAGTFSQQRPLFSIKWGEVLNIEDSYETSFG